MILGEHDITNDDPSVDDRIQQIPVIRIETFQYDSETHRNDILLLELSWPAQFTGNHIYSFILYKLANTHAI